MDPTPLTSLARLGPAAAFVGLLAGLAGCAAEPERLCVDDVTFFEETVWREVLQPQCAGCHLTGGVAADSDFVLVPEARPDHLDVNRATLGEVASLSRNGVSVVLLKPQGELGHGGGGVLQEGSEELAILREFTRRLRNPVASCGNEESFDDGIAPSDAAATLRKATLLLVGRLPTEEELDSCTEEALPGCIDELTADPSFEARVVEWANDWLLTDKYLRGTEATQLLDYDAYPNQYWYESASGSQYNRWKAHTNAAIARQPLELVAHIVREDRPWTELLTADYAMLNGYSALSFGVTDLPEPDMRDSERFVPVSLPGVAHAGVLTTPSFLARYPTTATNRNRHRARIVFDRFLATDLLALAERPIDVAESQVHNPTLNDPQCGVCHAVMEPIAGAFQNWDAEGRFAPPETGWFPDMMEPGWGGEALPSAERERALQWLAQRIVDDPRFALASARWLFTSLLGPALTVAADAEAYAHQQRLLQRVAEAIEADWRIEDGVRELVLSSTFRAADAPDGPVADTLGKRLLTPEELDRKLASTLGQPWTDGDDRPLLQEYTLLFGGIDSDGVTERLREPNGLSAAVGLRMAHQAVCPTVPREFALPADQRELFGLVELTHEPETELGFQVPKVQALIRDNLVHLHRRLLGEAHAPDSPAIDAAYELWLGAWRDGKAAVAADEFGVSLDNRCRVTHDPLTGEELPSEQRITQDPDYTLRAWMAVTTYLLADAGTFLE